MRKITSLLMLFMILAVNALAQNAPVRVTALDQIKQDKCYTLTAPRSALCVASADATVAATLATSQLQADAKDAKQQFAFVKGGNNYYLYSVAAKKYVNNDKSLSATPNHPVAFEKGNPYKEGTTEKNDRPDAVKINMGAGKVINIGGDNQLVIDSWNTTDIGNSFYVEEAGDITPVVVPVVPPVVGEDIPEVGKSYYFYNKHKAGNQYFNATTEKIGFNGEKMEKYKSYVWTCEDAGNGKLAFKNLETNMYFGWQNLSSEAYGWAVDATVGEVGKGGVVNKGCVTLKGTEKFLVGMVGKFDQAGRAGYYDDKFSSDFKFELCTNTEWEEEKPAKPINYYSKNFGDNWVRILWNNNISDAAGLVAADAQAGRAAISEAADYTDAEQLWALVGDATNGFYLQNKAAGAEWALTVANTGNGAAATLAKKGDAKLWTLSSKGNGVFAICPKGSNMSLNSYGGARKELKLYGDNDGGSKWQLQTELVEAFKMSVMVEGENPYGDRQVSAGEHKFVINGKASYSAVPLSGNAEAAYYLPKEARVTLTQSSGIRGFAANGFSVNGKEVKEVKFTVGDEVNLVKSYFKASVENGLVLYFTPDAKGKPYRIPAITTAKNGDIFAIADNRPAGADIGYGEVDIKCRISKDNGQTWGEEFFIADGHGKADASNKGPWDYGFGDAAVVADRERNEILVMMVCGKTVCWDGDYDPNDPKKVPNRVAQVRAKLNAETGKWEWTAPKEVTESIYPLFVKNGQATVKSLFIGSGRICQSRVTKVGDYYRLYCSTWTKNQGNRVIYSDDFGDTWHILGTVDDRPGKGGDEPKCEEMPNGNVILSSRRSGRLFNIFTYTNKEKGEGKWQTEQWSENQTGGIKVGNSTNGEIMVLKAIRKSDNKKVDVALQSVPFGSGRSDVGFYFKEITEEVQGSALKLAENWTKGLHVSKVGSAYSTMTLQNDHKIGFLFEEEPGSYCIVYIPLKLETITNDKYSLDGASYPTGIGEVVTEGDGAAKAEIYDLSGRRVNHPEKGVFIINGKKVILK